MTSPIRFMGALLLTAASAQAFVLVTPRAATLLSGRTRAFQILAAGNEANTDPILPPGGLTPAW